jgi:hypothetical protein
MIWAHNKAGLYTHLHVLVIHDFAEVVLLSLPERVAPTYPKE